MQSSRTSIYIGCLFCLVIVKSLDLPPLAVGADCPLWQVLAEVEDAFQAAPPSGQLTRVAHPRWRHWQAWQGSDAAAPLRVAFFVGESDEPWSYALGWFFFSGPLTSDPDLDPDPDLVAGPDLGPCCLPCFASPSLFVQALLKRVALCCSEKIWNILDE